MTTDNNPFADVDTIPGRLEDGIETITGNRPITPDDMTRDMRGGAAAGVLIGIAVNAYYSLITGDTERTGPAIELHHSLVSALESCAGDVRVNVVQTFINIVTSWLDTPNMRGQLGDQASAAIDHLEAAFNHIAAAVDTDDETRPMHTHGNGDDESFAPRSVPDGAVERLGEASSALGIMPVINVEGDTDDIDHPLVPVAVMSGIVIGRATMEFVEMVGSADGEMQGLAAPLWVNGFRRGVAMEKEPHDDMIAVAALRLVNIIGLWHQHRGDAPYAPAIASLCRAAWHTGCVGGLTSSDVDVRAEYIANYGADEADTARKALEAAEAAVKHLKNTAGKV